MLTFVQELNKVTDEFVFKGGNLLWLYIKTPRPTVDIDLATKSLSAHQDVRHKLEEVCRKQKNKDIQFSIKAFEPVERPQAVGASVTMHYVTSEGQENTFPLDIVYAIPALSQKIRSPIETDSSINVTAIENIIADKLMTCQKFKSGNTRMKDFDDLWRVAAFKPSAVNWKVLKEILESRGIKPKIDTTWLNPEMDKSWNAHLRRNQGLPQNLKALFESVNEWLNSGLGYP